MPKPGDQERERPSYVEEWHASLSEIERRTLQYELGKRHSKYHESVMPSRRVSPPIQVNSRETAQYVVLLEVYYNFLKTIFSKQNYALSLQEFPHNPILRSVTQQGREEIAAEYTPLMAVIDHGDWKPLKVKWREILEEPKRPSKTGSRLDDMMAEANYNMEKIEYEGRRRLYDFETAERVIRLIPDHTKPMDPRKIDPDPPLIPD